MNDTKQECCKDWEIQIHKINAPIILQCLRTGRTTYDGLPFQYCPWCGNKREDSRLTTDVNKW
jgi:hypothetical protein